MYVSEVKCLKSRVKGGLCSFEGGFRCFPFWDVALARREECHLGLTVHDPLRVHWLGDPPEIVAMMEDNRNKVEM